MRPKKSAIARKLPTFAQLRRFLADLGFTHRAVQNDAGRVAHIYEHKASGCKIFFADYPPDKPTPNHAVMSAHFDLTWFDLIDDIPYEQFLDLFAPAKAG